MDGVDLLIAAIAALAGGSVLASVSKLSKRVDACHQRIDSLRDLVARAHGDEEPPGEE